MLHQITFTNPKDREYIPLSFIDNYAEFDEIDDMAYCQDCKEPMQPVYENNGFNEPDPTHYEIVGYEYCYCEL